MDFSQFCRCSSEEYERLRRRIDDCASQGRSYEFAACRLPAHCQPVAADLGFWRQGRDYLLYFRPAVRYQGQNPRLKAFFSRTRPWRFPDFQGLTRCLTALGPDADPPEEAEPALFCQLRQALSQAVLGQPQAVEAVAFKLYGHIGKREPRRPLSLIFYGPTGVGKSELGKALAPALNRCLGRRQYQLVWTELNTFTEAHSAYRLTGSPPGYVGYEDPPILEAARQNPYTVFMFDELDKAHPEVLKTLMSVLDEGRCAARKPDSQGSRELDFRRCILLFTANYDLSGLDKRPMGFSPQQKTAPERGGQNGPAEELGRRGLAQRLYQADEAARTALIQAGVLREIAGRFSGLIGFQPLTPEARAQITAKQIQALGREYGLELAVSPALAQALTPAEALSPRSAAAVLEGLLTPLLLEQTARQAPTGLFRLEGAPDRLRLLPPVPQAVPAPLPAF